jgi:hypothetical protein
MFHSMFHSMLVAPKSLSLLFLVGAIATTTGCAAVSDVEEQGSTESAVMGGSGRINDYRIASCIAASGERIELTAGVRNGSIVSLRGAASGTQEPLNLAISQVHLESESIIVQGSEHVREGITEEGFVLLDLNESSLSIREWYGTTRHEQCRFSNLSLLRKFKK